MRRMFSRLDREAATEQIIALLTCTTSNDEFIDMLKLTAKKNADK